MPDFSVPSWLQPPSEVQRQQLALQEEQVKQKGVSLLRKQVGMARMKEDANRYLNAGMDDPTARKMALIDNADLLFVDEPEALAKLVSSDEATAIRQRAQDLLTAKQAETEKYHQELLNERAAGRISRDQASMADQMIKFQNMQIDALRQKSTSDYQAGHLKVQEEANRLTKMKAVNENLQMRTANQAADAAQQAYDTAVARGGKESIFGIDYFTEDWEKEKARKKALAEAARARADKIRAELMGKEGITEPGPAGGGAATPPPQPPPQAPPQVLPQPQMFAPGAGLQTDAPPAGMAPRLNAPMAMPAPGAMPQVGLMPQTNAPALGPAPATNAPILPMTNALMNVEPPTEADVQASVSRLKRQDMPKGGAAGSGRLRYDPKTRKLIRQR